MTATRLSQDAGAHWQGFIWRAEWACDGEGPYTILAKAALANAEGERWLRSFLFGRAYGTYKRATEFHPRTLLSSHWIVPGAAHTEDVSRAVQKATIDKTLGAWWRHLCSDANLRFCCNCLKRGFHSELCQIEGINTCPAHGTPLQTSCCNCGHPSSPFALEVGFDAPLSCLRCEMPLAGKGLNAHDTRSWLSNDAIGAVYARVRQELSKIGSSKISWADNQEWAPQLAGGLAARKASLFFALARVLDLPIGDLGLGAPPMRYELRRSEADRGKTTIRGRLTILKSVRRQLEKRYPSDWRSAGISNARLDVVHRQVSASGDCDPELHAALTTALRLGIFPLDHELRRKPKRWRPEVPVRFLAWPPGQALSDSDWGAFIGECIAADRRSARHWKAELSARDEVGGADWMELSTVMRQRLSANHPIPPGVNALADQSHPGKTVLWLLGEPTEVSI